MKVNDINYGFKLLNIKDIKDIGSVMYEFKHLKSGATLVYLENDDTNKCFSFGFRTLPEDSTGIPHIIEHSLLCGSTKYPLKEPFVNLIKGSMATFLNAMTAYDFTIYPVASQNDKDFDNLVSVYMDAVLSPLSIKDDKPFLQEGWHLEMHNKDDIPSYKGVVYNEMKGAMSSVEEQLNQATLEALYKGTCYEFNSGGDPDVIPSLTYDYYKEFYHRYYHPSNGLMYLYGKMDLLAKLKYFDEEYLCHYEESSEPVVIEVPKPLINLDYEKEYEISETEEEKDNAYMSLAFALDTYDNAKDLTAFSILNEALMSSNDSPIKKALLDANLGQDIVSMINDDNILPSYQIFLHKTNVEMKEKFYNTFINECKKLIENKIDKKLLLSVINNNEFKNKEMDSGRMPKGLFFAFNLMQSYNYNVSFENYLEYSKYYEYYKQELDNGYFESLLEKYIINSNHYVEVLLKPSKTLAKEKAEIMKEKMAQIKQNMSLEDIDKCIKTNDKLLEYQSKKDSLEDLEKLPKLELSDIKSDVNTLPLTKINHAGYELLTHEFNTNKIAYYKMYFDLGVISFLDMPYVRLLINVLGKLDTKNFTAVELQSYVKTYLGSLSFDLFIAGVSKDHFVAKLCVYASSLLENVDKISEVINEIINNSIYDEKKVETILLQLQNIERSTIIENGMKIAIDLARKDISKEGALICETTGLNMYHFLQDINNQKDTSKVIDKLRSIAKVIFNKNNVLLSLSGDEETINALKKITEKLDLREDEVKRLLSIDKTKSTNDALVIPSLVNYNAKGINLEDLGIKKTGKLNVLQHILNYDYLWPEIRVKGGAYGCTLMVGACDDVVFGSYRDPNVKNTYEVYDNVANYLENLEISEDEFKSYLIGAVGGYDQPASANSKIQTADFNYLRGVSDEMRILRKKEMLSTTIIDLKGFSDLFKKLAQIGRCYTIGNEEKINEYNGFKKIEKL